MFGGELDCPDVMSLKIYVANKEVIELRWEQNSGKVLETNFIRRASDMSVPGKPNAVFTRVFSKQNVTEV
ncbi:hypothetical protein RRG08_021938 [Elysia crispata]|uniref:Uncharacterized protein n=1 Tax=Elysia crispata TaxID=231223 RepID=A0AAE1AC29_9GAST|nr:hypothetical protein RRG08_021938 [Elysia crispata]